GPGYTPRKRSRSHFDMENVGRLVCVAAILIGALTPACGSHGSNRATAPRQVSTKDVGRSCARGIATLMQSLRRPMHAVGYVTRGQPELDEIRASLGRVFGELERASAGHFQGEIVEVTTPEQWQAAHDAGLQELQIGGQTAEGVPTKTLSFMGVAFRYGDQTGAIPFLVPESDTSLRFWMVNKVRELRDREGGVNHAIGVLAGTGEIKLTEPNLIVPTPEKQPSPT